MATGDVIWFQLSYMHTINIIIQADARTALSTFSWDVERAVESIFS